MEQATGEEETMELTTPIRTMPLPATARTVVLEAPVTIAPTMEVTDEVHTTMGDGEEAEEVATLAGGETMSATSATNLGIGPMHVQMQTDV